MNCEAWSDTTAARIALFHDASPPLVQVTPVSCLLKQSWSAGFLAAAFACGALKTAGDRHHLVLQENR